MSGNGNGATTNRLDTAPVDLAGGASVSPIEAAIASADSVLAWHSLQATLPGDVSWLSWQDVLDDDGPVVTDWLAAVRRGFSAPPPTAASYLLGWCAAAVAAPGAALLVAQQRVPVLHTGSLWLRRTAGHWVDATAVDPATRVLVLSGDPLAGGGGVEVVGSRNDLHRAFASGVTDLLAPLVDAVARHSRLGRRVRWGLVGDAVADMMLEAGRGLGDPGRGRDEADAVFAPAAGTLGPRRGWTTVDHGGTEYVFTRRSACCLAYQTPTGGYCTTCPSTPEDERGRRIRAYLDASADRPPLAT